MPWIFPRHFFKIKMRNIILTLVLSVFVVVILISSSGAPIGTTGAHGELTCGKVGCHTGVNQSDNINTGLGILKIESLQDISNYKAGEIYEISVTLDEVDVERFGFSLTVLDDNFNKVGELIVIDSIRTQVFKGVRQFAGREYITYRNIGTLPYSKGKGWWTFKWKAPDVYVGKITFYAAGVSANNDGTDKGDLVYTKVLIAK
jgi:hypothetical protein